jgi:hypothetical protein
MDRQLPPPSFPQRRSWSSWLFMIKRMQEIQTPKEITNYTIFQNPPQSLGKLNAQMRTALKRRVEYGLRKY